MPETGFIATFFTARLYRYFTSPRAYVVSLVTWNTPDPMPTRPSPNVPSRQRDRPPPAINGGSITNQRQT